MSLDGVELIPAGEIECLAVTSHEEEQYVREYGELASDALMSNTVTRYGTLFWDDGKFTPKKSASTSGQ